jgi:hypothetical protein
MQVTNTDKYKATRCRNPEDNKNIQGCGNFRSVAPRQHSRFSSVPIVCTLLTAKGRNYRVALKCIQLKPSAPHNTYALQGIKERCKQALILADMLCGTFLSASCMLLTVTTAVFWDLRSGNGSPTATSNCRAEALSTRRHGVTVLILAVVITKNLVFYSSVKSKCTAKNAN